MASAVFVHFAKEEETALVHLGLCGSWLNKEAGFLRFDSHRLINTPQG